MGGGSVRDVLAHPVFRRLFAAQAVALAGTGLLTVALGLLAYDLAGSAAGAVLGTALAIKMAAYVGVAPVITALTERLPRRTILVAADTVRATVALLLPAVDEVWQIYALIVVLQAASATFTPTFQAIIPAVLPDERDYTRALSLSRLAYDLEALLSPLLAAAVLTVAGYHWLFLGTVGGFAVSALLVTTTPLPAQACVRPQPLTSRILAGARILTTRPVLRGLLAMNLTVAAGTALVLVDTVVYVRDVLGGTDVGVALATGCFGAGSMTAALLVPRLLRTCTDRTLMLTGAALVPIALTVTAGWLAIGARPSLGWGVLGGCWFVLGAGTALVNTPAARLLRAQAGESELPAVFSAQFSLSHACFLLTYPIAGWLGVRAGHAVPAGLLAVLATLATSTAARLWPAGPPIGAVPARR
ncbi:MFS transporter [Nocardia farcinica]|uniref:MFS transporter n=1 Tax=Nocardia farcinica TaxID=37329 RepID=UPI001894F097|nr:MFS transporter [Nocardia farcinica]MBF6419620.1 MFS transporter [Nocardia farcinica]MBF6431097.1 MFS transporter [Nocardia farcinica]MBF6501611.1 MFS transporter [Nocardia farcinica]